MNIAQKIERSRDVEEIHPGKIICENSTDPLVIIKPSERIMVEPVWEKEGDLEGSMYAQYMQSHPEYNQIYVRSKLFKQLVLAADSLDSTYKLVVRAGHRPLAVQKRVLLGVMQKFIDRNPQVSNEEALEHARTYISDPDMHLPPHCCGAAVDVELFDVTKNCLVDFGSQVNEEADISHLHNDSISAKQKQSRMILLKTMLSVGFASYYAEWWHYSYGGEDWAWFYRKDTCLYGIVHV